MSSHTIQIHCSPHFIAEQSSAAENRFVFSYTINITNLGNETIKLLNRSWLVTDGDGKTSTVEGKGVIGLQPVIEPGKSFEYTSGAILETPVGTMEGHYTMECQGKHFDAQIPVFRLATPNVVH